MRILAEIGTDKILQVATGDASSVVMNGRWMVDSPSELKIPLGASVTVDNTLRGALWAKLAKSSPAFPSYSFNALQTTNDISKLDLTTSVTNAVIGATTVSPRLQTGRDGDGNAPNMTALLAANVATTPARPGMLQTNGINIGAFVPQGGIDTFMVHWSVWHSATTHDVHTATPTVKDTAAIKTLTKPDQNLAGLRVFLSNDGGANWSQVKWMEPIRLLAKNSLLRLLMLNDDANSKVYVLNYAILWGTE